MDTQPAVAWWCYAPDMAATPNWEEGFYLQVRRSLDVTATMVEVLSGDAVLELLGDLTNVYDELQMFAGAISDNRGVRLPLELETCPLIRKRILPRVGIVRRLWSISIEKHGRVAFSVSDGFYVDHAWAGSDIEESVLRTLQDRRAIHAYSADWRAFDPRRR